MPEYANGRKPFRPPGRLRFSKTGYVLTLRNMSSFGWMPMHGMQSGLKSSRKTRAFGSYTKRGWTQRKRAIGA